MPSPHSVISVVMVSFDKMISDSKCEGCRKYQACVYHMTKAILERTESPNSPRLGFSEESSTPSSPAKSVFTDFETGKVESDASGELSPETASPNPQPFHLASPVISKHETASTTLPIFTEPARSSRLAQSDLYAKHCYNCNVTWTTAWKRDENWNLLCSPCAIYWKAYGKARPFNVLKRNTRTRRSNVKKVKGGSSNTKDMAPISDFLRGVGDAVYGPTTSAAMKENDIPDTNLLP
ncbi:unnamed protein product [Caenorhabditis sp. 36 PRJEB53466]|nr:unnamed protein product [Caenorhabditis sp. 36 PRJEB53466]